MTSLLQLYTQHDVCIGQYAETNHIPGPLNDPVYAVFRFSFDHELLFFDAMLALCMNRWVDEMILQKA